MKVFKFGGASVKDARGVRNIASLILAEESDLLVVISAIGKTTNALEVVAETHHRMMEDLALDDYDKIYDAFVSQGELNSTRIISEYLNRNGVHNTWLDARRIMITDNTHRAANVRFEETQKRLKDAIETRPSRVYIIQGYIGATEEGEVTTLGREGSDYSAAVFGAAVLADSVTLWKDVPGVLTADPRKDETATLIPEMTYEEAIRLTESGAQIIHPKTIKPLAERHIPLYVKSFDNPKADGTVIR